MLDLSLDDLKLFTESLSLDDLKPIAKSRGIKGYKNISKKDYEVLILNRKFIIKD